MMAALQWTGVAVAVFYLLWVHFLAVMHLKDARDAVPSILAAVHKSVQILADIVLAVGVILNLLFRVFLSWLIFWEVPPPFKYWGEWATSAQVKRLCNTGSGFRQRRAVWFRDNLLKPFDKSGGHD